MRIDSSGNVGIGTGSPTSAYSEPALHIHAAVNGAEIHLTDGSTGATATDGLSLFQYGTDGYIWERESGNLRFGTAATERMRIDASGNLLVGKTSSSFSVAGIGLMANDQIFATATSDNPLALNRLSTDGDICKFYKDGTNVGSIATWDGEIAIGRQNCALLFDDDANRIKPHSVSSNTVRDNALDLGGPSARFDDIYATNGTIQTSDRNEKQDIEALSDAEQRAAVAAKGLLRKFRWISSVEAKGDDARIHFGIIAQDLQDAFTAEGLDAGRYAMFISSTWTDEETGEERTRLGVRYSELLAFIISAI